MAKINTITPAPDVKFARPGKDRKELIHPKSAQMPMGNFTLKSPTPYADMTKKTILKKSNMKGKSYGR